MKKEIISGIYLIINLINNKVYVGQSEDIHRRWKQHIRLLNSNKHYNKHLQNAWNKYKSDSFKFIIIYKQEIYNLCELNKLETEYIIKYNSIKPSYGYNSNLGGDNPLRNEETKQKISEILEKKVSKPIYQIDKEGNIVDTYKSPRDVNRKLGISRKAVYSAIKRINSVSNGYSWIYVEDYNNGKFDISKCDFERKTEIKVVQMDDNYKMIEVYNTITDASIKTKIGRTSIGDVCLGERCTAGGYFWISYDDYCNGIFSRFERFKYKTIYQFSIYGEFIREWIDVIELCKETGYESTKICTACSSGFYYPYGYVWSYTNEFPYDKANMIHRIFQCDLKLNKIKLWNSLSDISEELEFDKSAIIRCCNFENIKAYGYTWFYEKDFEQRYNLLRNHKNKKEIILKNVTGQIIKKWQSLKEACREMNEKECTVSWRIRNNKNNPDKTKYEYIN